jgi:cell division protease FtsH
VNGNDRPPVPTPPAPTKRQPAGLIPGGGVALALILVIGLLLLLYSPYKRITYSEFEQLVDAGQIKTLKLLGADRATGEVRSTDIDPVKNMKLTGGSFEVMLPHSDNQYDLIARVKEADKKKLGTHKADAQGNPPQEVKITKEEEQLAFIGPFLWTFLPLVLFGLFFVFYLLPRLRDPAGGGFLNAYIRSPARRYEKGRGRITFDDVAGMENAKRELTEVVEFLKTPDKFTKLGAQVPKGVLLVGPPGTGKTLLAKAVAGEANVPFFSINGSEFIQMFVGVGASRVRDLFKTAKDNAPCVIFIDEIDAVGRMRGAGVGGGSDEREQTLNQILSEMDGFQPTETVIVMAATNRPDVLDAALLRPGRFDRHVTVDRPTWQGRLAILKVHTRNKPLADSVDLERIARKMIGMSGAELRNLCNEAALIATRENKARIEQKDFDAAADRVLLGLKREEKFGDEEKKRTAYHEAGHALTAWLDPKSDKIDRVSIIPRERAAGFVLYTPDEDRVDKSASELMAKIVTALGGRAADMIVFGEPLSGAMQDIKQATRIARLMVTQFGMSPRLGPVHFRQGEEHVFLGKEIHEGRDFSEGTARIIDEEIHRMVNEALVKAEDLLRTHRAELDRLVEALLVHEELDRDEVEQVLKGVPVGELRKTVPPAATAGPTPIPQPVKDSEPSLPPGLAFGEA